MSRISHHRRHGLSLAEALVALAICAALLACMAMAFSAAGNAVEMNDHFYRSLQQARTGMDMMVTEIRRCTLTPATTITWTSSSVTLPSCPDFSGDSVTFTYNNAAAATNPNTITLTDNTTGITSILVGENSNTDASPVIVSSAAFSGPGSSSNPSPIGYSTTSNANGVISVAITVQIGQYPIMNQIALSGSAAPRESLTSAFQ
jgi:hypothetical protein